jgi:cellulose synthase (UDP-forming)
VTPATSLSGETPPPAHDDGRPVPDPPAPAGALRTFLFQALAVCAVALGGWYLAWRWTDSLNPHALAFSVAVASAETLAYLGAILFFLSLWRIEDPPAHAPPRSLADVACAPPGQDRPLKVDVLVATLDEPVELVRRTVRDAKALAYPHPLALCVVVLDDGHRPAMRAMAREEEVLYLTRPTRAGFKAGNLKNGLDHTDGDLFVVCDADTRLFPTFLADTLGYFRDPAVAWVQTPQWFGDVPPGTRLPEWLARRGRLGRAGRAAGRLVEWLIGPLAVGADPLGTDARAFYDLVQRARNWCNASFCCGAGSVHRREAVLEAALRHLGAAARARALARTARVPDPTLRRALALAVAREAARRIDVMPFEFHVSEDISTSLRLHADGVRRWRSVYHPRVLTRMLSPQDVRAWTVQRFKYATGTLDLALRANPLRLRGLSGWQRVMYAATMYAYLAPLWTIPLVLAPLVWFFTGLAPVRELGPVFWAHLAPFLVASRLALLAGTWGTSTRRSEQYHLASSWLHLRALAHVVAGRPLRFPVTPKEQASGRWLRLVVPHLVALCAMAVGIAFGAARLAAAPATAPAFVANLFWTLYNASCLAPLVLAAAAAGPDARGRP